MASQYAGQVAIIRTYSTGGSPPFFNETAHQKMHVYPPPYRYNNSWAYATPWLYVDGYRDAAYLTSSWNTEINQQLQVPADLLISLNGTFELTTNELSLRVGVFNTGTNAITGRFYAVLTEDNLQWSAPNGEQTHNSIPRIYWPNANGQEITASPGIENNFNITWNIDPAYDQNKLKIIAYVQDYNMQPDSIYIISQGAVSDFLQLQPPLSIPGETPGVIADFKLEQNYPNPFNPETTIEFYLPKTSDININIYNSAGQKIRILVHDQVNSGYQQIKWNGKDDSGLPVASGVYIYKFKTKGFEQTRKMLLVR